MKKAKSVESIRKSAIKKTVDPLSANIAINVRLIKLEQIIHFYWPCGGWCFTGSTESNYFFSLIGVWSP